MVPLDYMLAVALLTSGPDCTEIPCPGDGLASVRPTLQALAVAWEVLDPREIRYVLTRHEDFAADLKLLRRRHRELADAPPLQDCMRFPDRALINELLAFNRTYRQHLDNRQALEQTYWWELREAVQETERLYLIWDNVRDARCDYYYVTVRRQALKKIRETIGEDAYWSGTLPPHVPVWRFARID
jgi:hypothetical protein